MPLEFFAHTKTCARADGGQCNCNPIRFQDYDQALTACLGNRSRVTFKHTTPDPRLPDPIPDYQSQARRHLRPISD